MIAFSLGFIVCALIWAGSLFRRADNAAELLSEQIDSAYRAGYERGLSRKPPQLHQFQ